jgi:hypothetical protein
MPSLIGTGIDANYRKEQAPYSRFGSRKVVWFTIGMLSNRLGDGAVDNVAVNTLIDAIQTRAEVAIIGAPRLGQNFGRITVGIFEDTFNNGADTSVQTAEGEVGYNAKSSTLQEAVMAALNDNTVDVHQVYMYGGWSDQGEEYGWSTNDTYREYNSKSEFDNNSYLNPLDM